MCVCVCMYIESFTRTACTCLHRSTGQEQPNIANEKFASTCQVAFRTAKPRLQCDSFKEFNSYPSLLDQGGKV